jgi:hypothetical protein
MHPVGTSYIKAPEDQPWLLGSVPRDIQEYFDEIYAEIQSLTMVPCRKGERPWNSTVQPKTWEVGSVSYVFA